MRFFYLTLLSMVWPLHLAAQTPDSATSVSASVPPAPGIKKNSRFGPRPGSKPSFMPAPVVFYQQETGFAAGVAVVPVWRFGTDTLVRKSNARLIAWYSQQKQSTVQLIHTVFTPGEEFFFSGELTRYNQKLFYYGVGNNNSSKSESELSYKLIIFDEKALKRVAPDLFVGLRYRFTNTTSIESMSHAKDEGANYFLRDPRVSARERQDTRVSGLGPAILYDSRDNVLATYKGAYVDAHVLFNDKAIGSEYKFVRYQLDARYFRPLTTSNNTILALQYVGQLHTGSVPFRELGGLGANLGGALYNNASLMRGIYEGRFRDRQMMTFQAEIRQKLFWRIDGVVFGAVGQVGNKVSDYSFDQTRLAGGGGLRFRFNRLDRLNIRLDCAGGTDTAPSVYFAVSEAF
ncbi:outer membrane protein assembly factor [Hymenobacter tibetensis]|uniref:Outer membrane protein assembly factor n=1 Tax=Hymenobacter tibetensis TaxID=497967 RepID=A0ABY4D0K3_9BACT|nr:BamA/TamA family outer membrane protein [Hymenobacter tibetensis]UOG75567.1 outer membrane protein assembly factor [Hymenobacter tibetensis]